MVEHPVLQDNFNKIMNWNLLQVEYVLQDGGSCSVFQVPDTVSGVKQALHVAANRNRYTQMLMRRSDMSWTFPSS